MQYFPNISSILQCYVGCYLQNYKIPLIYAIRVLDLDHKTQAIIDIFTWLTSVNREFRHVTLYYT